MQEGGEVARERGAGKRENLHTRVAHGPIRELTVSLPMANSDPVSHCFFLLGVSFLPSSAKSQSLRRMRLWTRFCGSRPGLVYSRRGLVLPKLAASCHDGHSP